MTSLQKKRRIVDRDLLDTYHNMPCACRGPCFGQVVGHHIKSKGSGGDDVPENLIPLCTGHHMEIHSKGVQYMMVKHPEIRHYFIHGEAI